MYRDFGTIFVFIILGIFFVYVALVLQKLVAPSKPTLEKQSTYECGEDAEGSAWIRFNIRFYIIALIFLIFDVEVVFLFPWAVIFSDARKGVIADLPGMTAFVEMGIFLLILIVGLAYVWRKADLDWVKRRVSYAHGRYKKMPLEDETE